MEDKIKQLNPYLKKLTKELYDKYKQYKLEYEDILQELYLIALKILSNPKVKSITYIQKAIYNNILKYINKYIKNPLSSAVSIDLIYDKNSQHKK